MTIRVDVAPTSITPLAFSDELRDRLRAIPGLRWDRVVRCYGGPRHALEVAIAELAKCSDVRMRGELPPAAPPHACAPVGGLRDYQATGATWIVQRCLAAGGALLADDMGLGKSAQAIRAAEVLAARRARAGVLVLCPAVVAPHWATGEVPRWSWQGASNAGQCATMPKRAATKSRPADPGGFVEPRTDFRVTSYDLFRRHWKAVRPADVVILDEAQYLMNARSQRSRALEFWLASLPSRPYVIALTGTPMTTRPRDLYGLLEILEPGGWGGFWQFTKRYCAGRYVEIPNTDKTAWECDGASRLPELRQRLAHIMLRRSKAEVGGLPPKIRSVVPVELPVKARRQAVAAAREAVEHGGSDLRLLADALAFTEQRKLSAAVELAQGILESGGHPLIFTTRKDAASKIAAALGCPCITGDVAASRRAQLAQADAVAATIYSLTTGIPLTQFDAVIFVGLDWVPSNLLQAEARPHRIGQTKTINVYYLIGIGTADEAVAARVIERLETFEQVVGGAEDGAGMRDALAGSEEDLIGELIESVKGLAT